MLFVLRGHGARGGSASCSAADSDPYGVAPDLAKRRGGKRHAGKTTGGGVHWPRSRKRLDPKSRQFETVEFGNNRRQHMDGECRPASLTPSPPDNVLSCYSRWTMDEIDWTDCADMERVPGRCSGQWTVVGTRILPACVTDNMDDLSPEEIDDQYPGLGVERARRIIEYARRHAHHPSPAG